jgi:hypothetical protein
VKKKKIEEKIKERIEERKKRKKNIHLRKILLIDSRYLEIALNTLLHYLH